MFLRGAKIREKNLVNFSDCYHRMLQECRRTGFAVFWKSIFEKTRVGFGSPELSLRLSCTEFCALSSGHGPRDLCFYGGSPGADFCILGGQILGGGVKKQENAR